MYKLIKKVLFLFTPETIHKVVFNYFKLVKAIPGAKFLIRATYKYEDKSLEQDLFGLHFSHPVGLAAGLDKNATAFDVLGYTGFSFVEIGTVTPKAQLGNPQPRLFRLVNDNALLNRMGFNNEGVEPIVKRLKKRKSNVIIGGNIGKNKVTDNALAIDDYEKCFLALYNHVDYFVVNVSSPNTPNLRDLQEKEPLMKILNHLQQLNGNKPKQKPILLKIAPDLTDSQLDDIIEIVNTTKINGVVATNTTISREKLSYSQEYISSLGAGGISGAPVKDRSTEVIRYLHTNSQGSFPIIGVGGIMSPQDAYEKLEAGAKLIQLYTGFIYEGPGLIKRINKYLVNKSWKAC